MVNGCSSVIGLLIAGVGLIGLTAATVDSDKMLASGAGSPDELIGVAGLGLILLLLGFAIWIGSGWFSDDTSNKL